MSGFFTVLISRTLTVACLLIAGMTWSGAALAADAARGETLAKRWCAACHVVSADQAQGGTQAPAFSTIAKTRGLDAAGIALFLLAPHPKMPDMSLSRAEAADLAAYIHTQK
ncbi:MAG: c-type cytochrome [Rhodopseudomonas sp.]|nr:c-type cytochrome [Rhodopseudomonas sp.]